MTTELHQSAADLAAVDKFCDAFEAAGINPHRMSPTAVGSRALAGRETLRQVSAISGALDLASKIIDERWSVDAPDFVHNDNLLSSLLKTASLAATEIYSTTIFVLGEDDSDMPEDAA